MTITPFVNLIRLISDGEPVNASIANRAPIDLSKRTQHLKELLDALQAAQLLRVPDAVLEAGMDLGTPVYLDIPTNTYRPARSASDSQEDGNPALAESFLAGCVVAKTSDTRGDIGVFGRFVGLSLTDWANVVDSSDIVSGAAVPGRYYLSAVQGGKLTRTVSGLGVYVIELNSEGVAYIKAGIPDYASHTHHQFPLVPLPAVADLNTDMTQNGGTQEWSINAGQGDATEQGWLPADPAEGFTQAEWVPPEITDPTKAFYYNINHPNEASLRALFPPVPVDSYTVVQGGLVQPDSRVVVNQFGIWWAENRNVGNEAAPWSENFQSAPNDEEVIDFWFSRILLATDGGIVRSLVVAANSPLKGSFVDSSGDPATDGALQLIINALTQGATNNESHLAVKALSNNTFITGPVTSRVKSGGGVSVTGTHGNATDGWYGLLTLTLTNTLLTQGSAQSADLNNARAESINGFRGVSLVAGRTATPTWTVNIPAGVAASNTLRLKLWVHLNSDSVLPTGTPIQLNYKIIPPATTPAALPGSFTNLSAFTDATAGLETPRNGLYQVSDAFDIASVPAGSIVLVQLARDGGDSYAGNLTVFRVEYELI